MPYQKVKWEATISPRTGTVNMEEETERITEKQKKFLGDLLAKARISFGDLNLINKKTANDLIRLLKRRDYELKRWIRGVNRERDAEIRQNITDLLGGAKKVDTKS